MIILLIHVSFAKLKKLHEHIVFKDEAKASEHFYVLVVTSEHILLRCLTKVNYLRSNKKIYT